MSDDEISKYQLPVPEAPEAQSAKQRLRLSVPFLGTAMTMGEGAKKGELYEDDLVPILHFPGFGVTTTGSLHLEARGPRVESRVKIQTNGDVSLHSNEAALNIGAREAVLIGTDGPASTIASGGVLIAGGTFGLGQVGCGLQDPERDKRPATPPWVSTAESVSNGISAALNVFDAAMAFNRKRTKQQRENQLLEDVDISASQKWADLCGYIGAAFSLAGPLYTVFSEDNREPNAFSKSIAGTTIFGQSGLVMGSMATAGLYSLLGTGIYSPVSVSLDSGNLTEVHAKKALSILSGGDAEVAAEKNLFMVGGSLAQLGSNDRLTLAAHNFARLHSDHETAILAGGSLIQWAGKNMGLAAEWYGLVATDSAQIHGNKGLTLASADGDVAVWAGGVASVGGTDAAKLHSQDALVDVTPGTITLSVKGDVVASNVNPRDVYRPQMSEVIRQWSRARSEENEEETKRLEDKYHALLDECAAANKKYLEAINTRSANTENGIEITSSDIVLNVGGDGISVKAGKMEVSKTLSVKW